MSSIGNFRRPLMSLRTIGQPWGELDFAIVASILRDLRWSNTVLLTNDSLT